ncbi:MAG: transketolase [Candidatus Saccharibacteria bacterium]|nr:transketolase [Rhodoferax sp.]
MRKQLCDALVARSSKPEMTFLTGDLGFMALEPLRETMGQRFINAGVAEQNMVTVAAAMAKQALEVWVYSIAPFCYARPFEQIRNDVCFHQLPVNLIGNGGGYGYGVMGPTHHAIEDYGVLLTLPNMKVFAPVFDEDVEAVIERAGESSSATYVRLGRGEPPKGYAVPAYAPWRQLCSGGGPVVIAVGPLAGTYIEVFSQMLPSTRPNLWAVAELPIERNDMPAELLQQIGNTALLCVAEEHVRRGSFASELTLYLAGLGVPMPRVVHLHARAHHYERYGAQPYMRRQSQLDPQSMLLALEGKLHG